jgi:hypothetical protein
MAGAAVKNFELERGDSFSIGPFTLKLAGNLLDLTGYSFDFKVRSTDKTTGPTIFTATSEQIEVNLLNNSIRLPFLAEDTYAQYKNPAERLVEGAAVSDDITLELDDQSFTLDLLERGLEISLKDTVLITQGVRAIRDKDTDYYANLQAECFIFMDARNGNVNLYLPVANESNAGLDLTVQKSDGTSYTVMVWTSLGQVMNSGTTSLTITDQHEAYVFTSTGTGYAVS